MQTFFIFVPLTTFSFCRNENNFGFFFPQFTFPVQEYLYIFMAASMQLFVQGAGLVLGSGVADLSVKAAALLPVATTVKVVVATMGLVLVCMGLIGRVVCLDKRGGAGALNRLLLEAYGDHAGVARLAQQLLLIAGMPVLARAAFALVTPSTVSLHVTSLAFVVTCVVLKGWCSRMLDIFNAVTGCLEVARWVVMVGVLAGVLALGVVRHPSLGDLGVDMDTDAHGHSARPSTVTDAMTVAMAVLFGFGGMEVMVDKVGGQVTSWGFVKAATGVLCTAGALYVAVPVLVTALVPRATVQAMHSTGNSAMLNNVLLRLCMSELALSPGLVGAVAVAYDGLVFVSLANGVTSLADFNVDSLRNIATHSARPGTLLHCLRRTEVACAFVVGLAALIAVAASDLINAVSDLILLSHIITGIAFWAVYVRRTGPRTRTFSNLCWCLAHTGAMTVMLAAIVYSAPSSQRPVTLGLVVAVVALPLLAVHKGRGRP